MDSSGASDLNELVDEPRALRLAMRRSWTSEDQYLGLGRDFPVVRCDPFPWVPKHHHVSLKIVLP